MLTNDKIIGISKIPGNPQNNATPMNHIVCEGRERRHTPLPIILNYPLKDIPRIANCSILTL